MAGIERLQKHSDEGGKVKSLCQKFEAFKIHMSSKPSTSSGLLRTQSMRNETTQKHRKCTVIPELTRRSLFEGKPIKANGKSETTQQTPSLSDDLDRYYENVQPVDEVIYMNLSNHPKRTEIDLIDETESNASYNHMHVQVHKREMLTEEKNYPNKVRYLIQELFQIERNYVQSLKAGVRNFIAPFENFVQCSALQSFDISKLDVFWNIEAILEFHESRFLPTLVACGENLKEIANAFSCAIEGNQGFDNYIGYVLNRRTSAKLCSENKYFFLQLSEDKLGINGFLLLPIQHLPRLRLVFVELIKELLKDIRNNKDDLVACCNAERSIEKLIEVVDRSCG